MGNSITNGILDKVAERQQEAMIRSRLADMKQAKRVRDYQIATQMALTRDRIWWMTGFYVTMGAVSIGRMIYIKQLDGLPLKYVPYVLVPFLIGYQIDFAYGTKAERVNREALKIMNEEEHWFNEPIELPELLKEPYRKMQAENEAKLRAMGKENKERPWAK